MAEKKRSYEVNKGFCKKLNDQATDLAMAFIHKYFWDESTNSFQGDLYWIENQEHDLHQNVFINDYYFSLDAMYHALWYNIPKDELFQWYDHVQRSYMEGSTHHNLRNWYLLRHQVLQN